MSDSEYDKLIKIVRAVRRRTESRELEWRERNGRDFCYEADLESANVEIGTVDNDGAAPYDFRVYGPMGGSRLATLDGREFPEAHDDLQALHSLVDRQVRGVEDIFEALLRELGE